MRRTQPGQSERDEPANRGFGGQDAGAILDVKMVEALSDDTTRAIARESTRLRDRQRNLVLGIVRQFEGVGSREEDERGAPSGGR